MSSNASKRLRNAAIGGIGRVAVRCGPPTTPTADDILTPERALAYFLYIFWGGTGPRYLLVRVTAEPYAHEEVKHRIKQSDRAARPPWGEQLLLQEMDPVNLQRRTRGQGSGPKHPHENAAAVASQSCKPSDSMAQQPRTEFAVQPFNGCPSTAQC